MSVIENLNTELRQVQEGIARYMRQPESKVPDWAKLIALAIREVAVRADISAANR
jgi:hypothetical protein